MRRATWARLLTTLFLLSGASCKAPTATVEASPDTPPYIKAMYAAQVEKLSSFLKGGFVVSKWEDGEPEHEGDALLWTGMALGGLPCEGEEARTLSVALKAMFALKDGGIYRHPDLADKPASLDGALGLWWGIADRVVRCGEGDYWRDALVDHVNWIDGAGEQVIVPYFDYPARLLCLEANGCGLEPAWETLKDLQHSTVVWAMAVKAREAACYRVHLSFLALDTVEKLGRKLNPAWRDGFCAATAGMGLPTTDNFCGRGDLRAWIDNFEADKWEFRHQRCGAWEEPDGKPGLKTPGVDLLVALRTAYNL